jgi:hypothetical protein
MMDLYQIEFDLATTDDADPKVIGIYGLALFAANEAHAEAAALQQFEQNWKMPPGTGLIVRTVRTVRNGELDRQPWPQP